MTPLWLVGFTFLAHAHLLAIGCPPRFQVRALESAGSSRIGSDDSEVRKDRQADDRIKRRLDNAQAASAKRKWAEGAATQHERRCRGGPGWGRYQENTARDDARTLAPIEQRRCVSSHSHHAQQ